MKNSTERQRGGAGMNGLLGGTYGLFFLGALVYYLQQATTFWMGILGILKALVWPAMLLFKVFTLLQM
ncbi:MAG: hypothetical protein PHW50_03245 [Patescibacteria group bacterium]|nr:hypothetical protein [Patescibacteria group bacterium]